MSIEAAARLRAFVREHAPGQCKILSKGDECECMLCAVDELAALAAPAEPVARVYLVATGEAHEGQETYTRHDVRPQLCDAEVLYAAAVPQTAAPAEQIMPVLHPCSEGTYAVTPKEPALPMYHAVQQTDDAKDAARYRWLRNPMNADVRIPWTGKRSADALDAHIDVAMSTEQPK